MEKTHRVSTGWNIPGRDSRNSLQIHWKVRTAEAELIEHTGLGGCCLRAASEGQNQRVTSLAICGGDSRFHLLEGWSPQGKCSIVVWWALSSILDPLCIC